MNDQKTHPWSKTGVGQAGSTDTACLSNSCSTLMGPMKLSSALLNSLYSDKAASRTSKPGKIQRCTAALSWCSRYSSLSRFQITQVGDVFVAWCLEACRRLGLALPPILPSFASNLVTSFSSVLSQVRLGDWQESPVHLPPWMSLLLYGNPAATMFSWPPLRWLSRTENIN